MRLNLLLTASLACITPGEKITIEHPLPRYLDLCREQISLTTRTPVFISPPTVAFQVPPEYFPVTAVIVGWVGFTTLLTDIGRAVNGIPNTTFIAVQGPKSITGVQSRYQAISIPLNTVWMRDYGPIGIDLNTESIGFADPIYRHYQYRTDDDKLPTAIAKTLGASAFSIPLILDGGNFMVDSHGTLFMSKRIFNWNSDKKEEEVLHILKSNFAVTNIVTFPYSGYPNEPLDGTGHIDMFVKLLSDTVVLISTSKEEPYKTTAETAIAYFKATLSPSGKPYRILEVPGWTQGKTWYTYSNSLIVNNFALVPSYKDRAAENKIALNAYQEIFGSKVVMIPSDDSITSGYYTYYSDKDQNSVPSSLADSGSAATRTPKGDAVLSREKQSEENIDALKELTRHLQFTLLPRLKNLNTFLLISVHSADAEKVANELTELEDEISEIISNGHQSLNTAKSLLATPGYIGSKEPPMDIRTKKVLASQINSASKSFMAAVRDYKNMQVDEEEKRIKRIEKRRTAMEAGGMGPLIQMSNTTLLAAQDRKREIEKIEVAIEDLCDLYDQVNEILVDQGEQVDTLMENMDDTVQGLEMGTKEIEKATRSRINFRRRMRICVCIIIVLVVIGGVLLYFFTKNFNVAR